MIFEKLTVHNFGPYRSQHEYILKPRTRYGTIRPIILFGGKNGAGKTTIFEAINLCLYGSSSIGKSITNREYEEYLFEKIHRNGRSNINFRKASVSLDFVHAHAGIQDRYSVCRSWERKRKRIKESLHIKKNDDLIDNLGHDQWNTFIKELIPPGVAQLFFFDGEKIRRLSGANPGDYLYLVDSIKSLFGVDLVEKLRKDLSIYCKNYSAKGEHEILASEVTEFIEEQEEIESSLNNLKQDRAQLQVKLERKQNEIYLLEESFAASGGEFFEKFDSQRSKQKELRISINEIKEKIRELSYGLFPFALCPDLCRKVRKRLKLEQNFINWQTYKNQLENHMMILVRELESEASTTNRDNRNSDDLREILRRISEISARNLNKTAPNPCDRVLLEDLSIREVERIQSYIEESLNEAPSKMIKYCKQAEDLNDDLIRIDEDLLRVPSKQIVSPIMARLIDSNRELGALQQKAESLDKKIKNSAFHLDKINAQIQKATKDIMEREDSTTKLKLISQAQQALSTFATELKVSKVRQLEQTIGELFSKLCRKEDLLDRINIDPSDFSIRLYDKSEREIPKKSLSSGEKQVFAIAMLWALRIVSGRPIPVIIDTPLSRLDSDHRANLVSNYFPHASHQTIILATDTEIDEGFFDQLKDFMSHAYHLKYNEDQGMTLGEAGYFWKRQKKGNVHDSK